MQCRSSLSLMLPLMRRKMYHIYDIPYHMPLYIKTDPGLIWITHWPCMTALKMHRMFVVLSQIKKKKSITDMVICKVDSSLMKYAHMFSRKKEICR